ncbi:MAG: hypothetical protein ACLPYS_13575 [Vulcanimicrobiaceae bacterium]
MILGSGAVVSFALLFGRARLGLFGGLGLDGASVFDGLLEANRLRVVRGVPSLLGFGRQPRFECSRVFGEPFGGLTLFGRAALRFG